MPTDTTNEPVEPNVDPSQTTAPVEAAQTPDASSASSPEPVAPEASSANGADAATPTESPSPESSQSGGEQAPSSDTTPSESTDLSPATAEQPYRGKYIAKLKIRGVKRDGELNVVTFTNNESITLPDGLLKSMATDKAAETNGIDLSPVQLRMMTIADEVEILLRKVYCVSVGEIPTFCKMLETVISNNFNLATRLLWGGKNKYQLGLNDVQDVLEKNAEEAQRLKKQYEQDAARNRELQRNQPVQ